MYFTSGNVTFENCDFSSNKAYVASWGVSVRARAADRNEGVFASLRSLSPALPRDSDDMTETCR